MAAVFRMDNRFGKTHKEEWLTPPEIIRALGEFDLDPCAPVIRPWPTAKHHLTVADDGLTAPWAGRIWMNPPFGSQTKRWMKRLAFHGNGIALIAARTDTAMFAEYVWGKADAVLFLTGRPHFHHVNGERAVANSGAPICLVAYGKQNVKALRESGLLGYLVEIAKENIVVKQDEYRRASSGTPEEIAIKREAIKRKLALIRSGAFIGPIDQRFTPPKYDKVYFEAMAIMDSEEFRRNH